MRRLALASILVAGIACGSSPKSGPVANSTISTAPAATAVKPGIYPCGFYAMDYFYGPYKCIVKDDNTIAKVPSSGGVTFTGTLAPTANGIRISAKLGCEIQELCNFAFTVDLAGSKDGMFKGKVSTSSKPDENYGWFLDQFQLEGGAFGGDQYGKIVGNGGAM